MKLEFKEFQKMVFEEYKLNGYAERWTRDYFLNNPLEFDLLIDLAEVGLINTEVSELLEDIRNNDREKWGDECADIVIRVMNFCNRKGINLEPHIIGKHGKNLNREFLHGRTI